MSLTDKLRKPKTLSALQSRLSDEKKKMPLDVNDLHEFLVSIVKKEVAKLAEPITEQVIESIDTEKLKRSVTPKKGKDYFDGRKGERGSVFVGLFKNENELPDVESYQQGDFAIVGEQGTIWYII